MKESTYTMSKFALGDSVETFEPNFEPIVQTGTVGNVTKVYNDHTDGVDGYDVKVLTTDGKREDFFFFEYELSEVK